MLTLVLKRAIMATFCAIALLTSAHQLRGDQVAEDSSRVTCHLKVGDSKPAVLADGRTLHVDVQSVASRGAVLLIVGAPAYVWAKGARLHDAPDTNSLIFGAVRDSSGGNRVVPSPTGKRPEAVHALSAGKRGWHVIFVEASKPPDGNALYDSAEVWYGRFDGTRWHDVGRILTARSASLTSSFSSDVVSDGTGVAFAFTFDRSGETHSDASGNEGVVVIRGGPGGWKLDTLLTRFRPSHVRIAPSTPRGSLEIAVVEPFFDERLRPQPPSVFLARLDSHWHEPRLIVRGSQGGIGSLSWTADHGRLLASWLRRMPGGPPRLEAAYIDLGSPNEFLPMLVRDSALAFTVSSPDIDRPLWLVRALPSPMETRAMTLRGTRFVDLGVLRIANHGLHPAVVARPDSSFLFISTALGEHDSDAPATTIITSLHVICTSN